MMQRLMFILIHSLFWRSHVDSHSREKKQVVDRERNRNCTFLLKTSKKKKKGLVEFLSVQESKVTTMAA